MRIVMTKEESNRKYVVLIDLSVSVAVPPAPVRVPSQIPLAPSVASVTSVPNDKGINTFTSLWKNLFNLLEFLAEAF